MSSTIIEETYFVRAFCKACLSVSLVAGTPPCNWMYLAHPRLPLIKAASKGVSNSPLEFRMIGLTFDL